MRRFPLLALSAALLVAVTASTAAAGPQRRIGVVVTLEVGVGAERTRAIADALGAALRDNLPVDVITGAEVERRLPPEGLPENCVGAAECRNDLGRRLDADELLMLAVVAVGDAVNVDATWADVAAGRTASRPRVTLKAGDDAKKAFAAVARAYLPHIRDREPDPDPKIVVVPTPAPQRDSSGRRVTVPVLIAGGVAVGAGIAGGVLAFAAKSRHDDLEAGNCREVMCDQGDIDAGRRFALGADIAFGAALAAGVTAGVLYYLSAPEGDGAPAIAPSAGPDRVGVSFGGRF